MSVYVCMKEISLLKREDLHWGRKGGSGGRARGQGASVARAIVRARVSVNVCEHVSVRVCVRERDREKSVHAYQMASPTRIGGREGEKNQMDRHIINMASPNGEREGEGEEGEE